MSIYGAKWTEGATVEFASYTDVCKQIINETDRETLSHRRFPLRFIFSNSAEDIRNIINSVHCELGARVLNISEVLNNDEQWPTRDEICRLIKNTETDTVLIALSEYLRFLNDTDFSSFLYAISSIEKPNVRVFIPMLGLWERFYALFWKEFYRAKEWAPVWRISSAPNKHTKIYCLQFNTDNLDSKLEGSLPGCKLVKSVSEWFSTYLQTEVEKIIIVSKVLNMLSKNASSDNAVDFRLLQDQKQLLEEVYGLEVPIDYNENEKRYWTQLFHLISQQRRDFSNSFLKIVEYHFNVHDMSSLSLGKIVRLIEQASDFDIWLLAKTLPKVNKSNEYLNICLSSLDSFKQEKLISKLWFKIFSFKSEHLSQKTCDERRDILREITRAMSDPEELIPDLEKELSTLLNKLDKREVIKYLTGLTSYERELIIKLLLEVDSKDGIRDELMKLYPELKYYIDWESIKLSIDAPEWIIRYFTLYNFSKLQNKKHEEIDTILNKFNHNKESFSEWYIHLNLVLKLIEDKGREMSSGTLRYIWIDGLGAEWLPLIANLVEKSGKATITFKALARVSLPSTTKCNRYEYEKIADLDNFVHSQSSYKHPECLVKEIEIIEKIVDKILRYPEERIIVVSDHGFSFLCTKEHGSYKAFNFDAEHEGRVMFMEEGNDYIGDEYYMVWNIMDGTCKDIYKKALIALKHLSLNNKVPYREVHGGATPEEVIVPFLIIEKKKESDHGSIKKFEVKFDSTELSLRNPILRFKIIPKPDKVVAKIQGKELNVEAGSSPNEFTIRLTSYSTGKYVLNLYIDEGVYEQEISIYGGFKERELF